MKSLVVVDLDIDEIQYSNFPSGPHLTTQHIPSIPQLAVEEFKERHV